MRYFNLFLAMCGILLLSSCSNTYDDVPLVIYNKEDPYIASFEQSLLENSEGLFTIHSYDSQNSQLIQNDIINDLILKNPKLLIINPVDRLGAFTIIEKAKQANVPVIFFNREPLAEDLNTWEYAFYVGALDEESAVIQSEMVIELFGDPDNLSSLDANEDGVIQLVILKGEQGHQAAEKRTTTIMRELEQHGYEVEFISIEVCDWSREIANLYMKELIPERGSSIELVISNNDAMALGAIDAMKEAGLFEDLDEDGIFSQETDKWIPVLGIDGLEDAIPYIEEGTLYGTVLNDSVEMAKAIIELAEAILNGEDPHSISFDIKDNSFIWVEYERFVINDD